MKLQAWASPAQNLHQNTTSQAPFELGVLIPVGVTKVTVQEARPSLSWIGNMQEPTAGQLAFGELTLGQTVSPSEMQSLILDIILDYRHFVLCAGN